MNKKEKEVMEKMEKLIEKTEDVILRMCDK